MGKLKREFLEKCLGGNACSNELVVLPVDGDVGFEEYFNYKTSEVIKSKRIFSPEEQNKLLLSYPSIDSKEPHIFERFFESPSIVAKNHEFEGCFGIDITDYIGKIDDEHFQRLLTYISTNKSAVYMLIVFSNNKNEIASMYDVLNQYSGCRLVNLGLPAVNDLVEYTVSKIRDFTVHVEKSVYKSLEQYYEDKKYGYETADRLVQLLKANDFTGKEEELSKTIEQMEADSRISGSSLGFGY